MQASDYIAIIAVILSAISIGYSIMNNFRQNKYVRTQHELNSLLLQKEMNEVDAEKHAEVSATVVKFGTDKTRIRVFNKGKAKARNVNMYLLGDHRWRTFSDILPLEFIDPGQSVDVKVSLVMGSAQKVKCVLTWNDSSGDKETEVLLTS